MSLDTSRELASSREGWIAARESVFVSAGSGDFGLTFSGSGSVSNTDSGSGYKKSDTYSNKVTLIKENTEKSDINKYFFSIIIFVISLSMLTLFLTLSDIQCL